MIELYDVPFLELDIDVPVDEILQEVNTIDEYSHWVPPGFEEVQKSWEAHKNYLHFAITTINPDRSHTHVIENFNCIVDGEPYNYYDHRKWFTSIVAEQKLPKTIAFIKSFTDRPVMAKIVKTPPFHILGWHSHQSDPFLVYNSPEQAITHIPLITNDNVRHYVSTSVPSDRWFSDRAVLDNDPNFWGHSFKTGKVSIFNGRYPHMMKSYSEKERLTLMIYNDLDDNPTMREHLRKAIKEYNGPLIPRPVQ